MAMEVDNNMISLDGGCQTLDMENDQADELKDIEERGNRLWIQRRGKYLPLLKLPFMLIFNFQPTTRVRLIIDCSIQRSELSL